MTQYAAREIGCLQVRLDLFDDIALMRFIKVMLWCCLMTIGSIHAQEQAPPKLELLFQATQGAAPGYVDDKACGTCHALIYKSYQHVGMAKSFVSASQAKVIEDFGAEYYHAPSQRYYQIRRDGQMLVFRRYQKDKLGVAINVFETNVDWVMGSGNRARSYIYQTEWGELFELPLGWYSERGIWAMSPGYEEADHPGIHRQVKRSCMFCHNAFPDVPKGDDLDWKPQRFPKQLPHGTGCQRCHGPGLAHIQAVMDSEPVEVIHERIVNPRKLTPEKRDSVCFQCHMLPAVSIGGARRFERSDYSFRPGESLADYMVHVEVTRDGHERFEINHHGYRLTQSACYQQSQGELGCISCHNPHEKPESSVFRASVAKRCVSCHADHQHLELLDAKVRRDCVSCHMPTRRTDDVIQVTMTDHRIAVGPFEPVSAVVSKTEQAPITDIGLLPFGNVPRGELGEIYRMTAIIRALGSANIASATSRIVYESNLTSPTPFLDLLTVQVRLRDHMGAEKTMLHLQKLHPDLAASLNLWGVVQLRQGKKDEAVETFERSIEKYSTPDGHFNLALALLSCKQHELALTQLNAAIALRSNMHLAWLYKGRVLIILGEYDKAKDALIRALEIEPNHTDSYSTLVQHLRRVGDPNEAERYLNLGLSVSKQPSKLSSLVR